MFGNFYIFEEIEITAIENEFITNYLPNFVVIFLLSNIIGKNVNNGNKQLHGQKLIQFDKNFMFLLILNVL